MVVAMAATAAVLAGVIVLERQPDPADRTASPAHPREPLTRPAGLPDAAIGVVPGDMAAPEQTNVAVILARPLFEPSRRPIAAPASIATVSGLPRLSGVMVTPAGRSVIFAAAAGGKPVIAVEGTRIGAYVVQAIGAGTVTIMGPDGIRTLRPSFDANRPPPPPAAALPFGPVSPPRPALPTPGAPGQTPDTLTLPLRTPS